MDLNPRRTIAVSAAAFSLASFSSGCEQRERGENPDTATVLVGIDSASLSRAGIPPLRAAVCQFIFPGRYNVLDQAEALPITATSLGGAVKNFFKADIERLNGSNSQNPRTLDPNVIELVKPLTMPDGSTRVVKVSFYDDKTNDNESICVVWSPAASPERSILVVGQEDGQSLAVLAANHSGSTGYSFARPTPEQVDEARQVINELTQR
jgi:hypothetical protein